jgi:hypothetical protein
VPSPWLTVRVVIIGSKFQSLTSYYRRRRTDNRSSRWKEIV